MATILECQIKKTSKRLHTRNILAQSWINFNLWFFRYRYFRVYAIFGNGPLRPSWTVNLHKSEIVPLGKSKRLYKYKETFWHKDGSISSSGSCHFRVCVILVTAPGSNRGLSICMNMKWLHSAATVVKSDQNTFLFS